MSVIAKAKENPVAIRFPKRLLEAVTESARRNGRSRNSEVLVLLAKALELDGASEGLPGDGNSITEQALSMHAEALPGS